MPATARDGLHGRQPGRRDRLAARLGRTARQAVRIPYGTRHPDRAAEKREGLSAESVARKAGPLDRHRLLEGARQPRVPLHRQTAAMDPQPVGRPVSRAGRRLRGHVRTGTLRSLCVQGRRDGLRGRSEPDACRRTLHGRAARILPEADRCGPETLHRPLRPDRQHDARAVSRRRRHGTGGRQRQESPHRVARRRPATIPAGMGIG